MTKRFAFKEKEMARVLLLVSREQAKPMPMPMAVRGDRAPERVFVCKTCDRVFPSFQALGGHRASHKKPRLDDGGDLKPKLHGCSICDLEFAIGQALGGHMRRHRAMAMGGGVMAMPLPAVIKKHSGDNHAVVGEKRGLWLDLNHPPCDEYGSGSEGDDECSHDAAAAGYTFHQFLDTTIMAVDCV
ncbi:zinc finger protein ZAT12-like [Triticum dicoccoides]|uniref:zinc finger protein ZAT12-like n=1 Tax=Triticum dicoccoides TaxID=85692 RepID=UPI00188F8F41|nr:zinc finger protein ZAT12-like [Triticum dicoccoides]